MSQQAKIAAALTRAGITKPEAWSAAGVPYQTAAAEGNMLSTLVADRDEALSHDACTLNARPSEEKNKSSVGTSDLNVNPPVILMKGVNDPTFVISFRSQKEFISALAWKSFAMVWGGAAITLLGLYMLLAQMELL
jgi:hypothetical protein